MSNKIPNLIMESNENLFYYNGQAIVGHTKKEMILAKKIMESKVFWYYLKSTSKPYSSDYYSFNRSYIRNFGVCDLTEEEMTFVINENNRKELDLFFENKYGISIPSE